MTASPQIITTEGAAPGNASVPCVSRRPPRPPVQLCACHCRSELRTRIIRNVQRLIIVLLIIIISSIVGPGVFLVLPELFPTASAAYLGNLLLTIWLVFNVVFNLVAATVKSAGVA